MRNRLRPHHASSQWEPYSSISDARQESVAVRSETIPAITQPAAPEAMASVELTPPERMGQTFEKISILPPGSAPADSSPAPVQRRTHVQVEPVLPALNPGVHVSFTKPQKLLFPRGRHEAKTSEDLHLPGHTDVVATKGASSNLLFIQRLLANVELDDTAPPVGPLVANVVIDRGSGTAGGAHSTAFVVFEWAAINAVYRKNFSTAVTNLMALCDQVPTLPGYVAEATNPKPNGNDWVDWQLGQIKSKPAYTNPAGVPNHRWVQTLNNFIKDYLDLRNNVPGSYVPGVSGAKGIGEKQEKEGAGDMGGAYQAILSNQPNTGGKLTKQFAKGMHLTHDDRAITEKQKAESIAEYNERIAPRLAQHIIACMTAYPSMPMPNQASIQHAYLSLVDDSEPNVRLKLVEPEVAKITKIA